MNKPKKIFEVEGCSTIDAAFCQARKDITLVQNNPAYPEWRSIVTAKLRLLRIETVIVFAILRDRPAMPTFIFELDATEEP